MSPCWFAVLLMRLLRLVFSSCCLSSKCCVFASRVLAMLQRLRFTSCMRSPQSSACIPRDSRAADGTVCSLAVNMHNAHRHCSRAECALLPVHEPSSTSCLMLGEQPLQKAYVGRKRASTTRPWSTPCILEASSQHSRCVTGSASG